MVHNLLASIFITLTVNEPANIGRQYSHKSISHIHNVGKTIHLTPFHSHTHTHIFSLSRTHLRRIHALSVSFFHTHARTYTHNLSISLFFSSQTTKNNHFSVADIFSHFCVVPKETMIRKGVCVFVAVIVVVVVV
jgi:hypothetical protein